MTQENLVETTESGAESKPLVSDEVIEKFYGRGTPEASIMMGVCKWEQTHRELLIERRKRVEAAKRKWKTPGADERILDSSRRGEEGKGARYETVTDSLLRNFYFTNQEAEASKGVTFFVERICDTMPTLGRILKEKGISVDPTVPMYSGDFDIFSGVIARHLSEMRNAAQYLSKTGE